MKKSLLYTAGFVEVVFCAGGIMNLLDLPFTLYRMGIRRLSQDPDYVAGMVLADVLIIALFVWLIVLTRRKLNSMR
jgi:hypothetical protein